jgi:hypothetical protein
MTDSTRFDEALARIDAANAEDPTLTVVNGVAFPHELHYARRMTEWLGRLEPDASEALRLAVRCQHLCRWTIPRSQFPMTRLGYLQWRSTLARFHADKAAEILRAVGFEDDAVARVQSLVRKERIKTDPEAQTLEDVACLVFLEDELADFARRHDEDKVVRILQKTWGKMSKRGHEAALALGLSSAERELLRKALAHLPVPVVPPVVPAGPPPAAGSIP